MKITFANDDRSFVFFNTFYFVSPFPAKFKSSFITLSTGGVFITGPFVTLNEGGSALSGEKKSAPPPISPLKADEGKG